MIATIQTTPDLAQPLACLRFNCDQGWRLFPVIKGTKHPAIKGWPELSTADFRQISRWAYQFPGCNWGIATGAGSFLAALDIDLRWNGELYDPDGGLSLGFLMSIYGRLPDTPIQRHDPNGGYHLFFRYPQGVKVKSTTIAEGVEVKADGRFIMIAPSSTRDLPYFWDSEKRPDKIPLADLPSAWIELIEDKPKPRSHQPEREYSQTDDTTWAAGMIAKLAKWRADDYHEWVNVGMALSSLGDAGLSLWDSWSRKSSKYQPGECEDKFATFKPGEGIGLGSLAHWAKEDGA